MLKSNDVEQGYFPIKAFIDCQWEWDRGPFIIVHIVSTEFSEACILVGGPFLQWSSVDFQTTVGKIKKVRNHHEMN